MTIRLRNLVGVAAILACLLACTLPPNDDPQDDPPPATTTVTGVSLSESAMTLEVNGTKTLIATVTPTDATTKSVSWASSDAVIAEVDGAGKVTAKAAGTAIITVTTTDQAKTASCTVAVNAAQPSDPRLAEAQAMLNKLPEMKVVMPASLAARATRSLGGSSRAVDPSSFAVWPITPEYNTSYSQANDVSLEAVLAATLDTTNSSIRLVKDLFRDLKFNEDAVFTLDVPATESTLFKRTKHSIRLTELSSGGYRIAWTWLEISRNASGTWENPLSYLRIFDVNEDASGKAILRVWRVESASVPQTASSLASEEATYKKPSYIEYDESSGRLAIFFEYSASNGDESYNYWASFSQGDEAFIFKQSSEIGKKEENYALWWGDDTDGLISQFTRYDLALESSRLSEDYFTDPDGTHPTTFIGGRRNHAGSYIEDYASFASSSIGEWPLDLLSVVASDKQLVRYTASETPSFFLTNKEITYNNFDPSNSSQQYKKLDIHHFIVCDTIPTDPSNSAEATLIGKITTATFTDPKDSATKVLYCWRDEFAASGLQPKTIFILGSPLAEKITAIASRPGNWMTTYPQDLPSYATKAAMDTAYCPSVTIDLTSL